mgnify:CR=1 FL=1|jgi:hypothetical protein
MRGLSKDFQYVKEHAHELANFVSGFALLGGIGH